MAATFFFKRGIPLRLFLIVPFVAQTITAVMITGWLAHRNGQHAVQELGNQLLTETSDRITQELHTYTDIPRQVMRANIDALDLQQLDLNNLNSWSQHLYRQSQRHPSIHFIYFGDDQGRYVEVEKKYSDRYEFSIQESIAGNTASYKLNQQGLPERFLRTLPYDPRQRPWYKKATASGQATWTAVYEFSVVYPTLGISFVQPYYDASGKQQGVLGADFTLQDISQHLNTLEIGQTGEAFIIERSGNLIASSYSESPGMPGQQQQAALSANQKLLRDTVAYLESTLGELETIDEAQQLRFERANGTHLVRVTPYVDEYGLDWLVLVAIPEADFAGQIQTNSRNTLLLCLLSLGGTIALGVLTARWVSDPLRRLSEASQVIAREETYQRIAPARIREINRLVQNFNRMGTELLQSRSRLEEHFQQLDTLVDQRTRALRQSEEKFVKIFQASPNGITLSTLEEGRFLDVNDRCAELFGRPKKDLIGRTSTELNIWVEPNTRADYQQQVVAGPIRNQEWQLRTASGAVKTVLLSAETIDIQGTLCVLSIANDISARQRAQAQLQEREARYRNLFESSPISLWEEDFSAAKAYIDALCASEQITDFAAYVDTYPSVVETFIAKIRILNVNQATLNLYEASQKSDLVKGIQAIVGPDSFVGFRQELIALRSGEVCVEKEVTNYTLTGKPKHLLIRVFIAPVHRATWARVLV
ncbi:MAG: cache domain-containing protein, partial [Cyanobacteria bacterium J06636_16]